MLQSYVIYIGVLLVSWLLAFLADKYNNKKLAWVIAILFTAIAGLRANTVGIDTYSYYTNFRIIESGNFNEVYGFENSFKYICSFLMKIYNEPTFIFTVLAFITNVCIVLRLWDFRNISSFSCMISCYYMGFFFMSMNGTRQFVAIAIMFYATKYFVDRKYLSYLIGLLIAMLFHRSACVGVILFVIELFDWKSLSIRQKRLFSCIFLASPAIIYFVAQNMSKYERYLRSNNIDVGVMVFAKLLFFICTLIFVFVMRGNNDAFTKRSNLTQEEKRKALLTCVAYFIGIIFALSSYIFPILNRIGWYFFIFEGVYMGMLIRTKNPMNKFIYVYCIILLVGWGFFASIANNSQGTMPYMFFWQ